MRRACAFSLIEVLSALALLVLLSGSAMSFFFGVVRRHDRLVEISAQQRDASLLFGRLESALFCALTVGPDGGAGVVGEKDSLAVVTRSVGPTFEGRAALGDAQSWRIAYAEAASAITLSMRPASESDGESAILLAGVDRLRFRYSDGRAWSSRFDSLASEGLPVAVEISIWLGGRTDPRPGASPEPPVEELAPASPFDLGEPDPDPDIEPELWEPREPDFVRVIVIPDAPSAAWKAGGP